MKKAFTPTPKRSYEFQTNKRKFLVRGFTIIEILVAITVFGIGVLGIAGFFITAIHTIRSSSNTTIASNLASGFIDEELATAYDQLTPGTGTPAPVSEDQSSPFYNFQKQINISCVDINLAATDCTEIPSPLKKIDIFIYWQERGNEKNIQMSTLKNKR